MALAVTLVTAAPALAPLGMDATSWLWQRAELSVLLECLSGYLRYRTPRKQLLSLEERERGIQQQMELDALKQQERAQQACGAANLLRGVANAARGQDSPAAPVAPATAPHDRDEPGKLEGEEVISDMRALALAACWLEDVAPILKPVKAASLSEGPQTRGS